MKRRKSTNKRSISFLTSVIFVIVIACIGYFLPEKNDAPDDSLNYTDYPFCVTFLDVGQGDCELITCGGYTILIDGGEAENASFVLDYLENNGIDKIDCYILTHPHSDHIGAAPKILSSVPCDKVFTTYFSEFNIPTTNLYENVLDAIYDSGAEPVAVEAGDSFSFGDLKLNIVAPIVESDDYNSMSIVGTVTYKDTTVLFTGDTTKQVEKQILENGYDVSADLLKAAHHGSTTSNSEAFIDAVSPDYAVFSCGLNNSYGHPHDEIVSLFEEKEIEYLRTDYHGTIVYYGDGTNMKLESIE